MNIGALLHLGVDFEHLKHELQKLNLKGYLLKAKEEKRHGISGINFTVELTHHHHHHTDFAYIRKLINESKLSENVKEMSFKIFTKVAEAEAKIHGQEIDNVHFHEVGAIDSIVDIVGAAICIDYLNIDSIVSSSVVLGKGFVKCEHGVLPVPAPATLEILKNIPVVKGDIEFEATTPTGAAIIAALADLHSDDIQFVPQKTAYGIGDKIGKKPNMLRLILAEELAIDQEENIQLECNIDDMNPEYFSHTFNVLLEAGALDVSITPIIMKKSRPAFKLEVLCKAENKEELTLLIFQHTTTLGVKSYKLGKKTLERKIISKQTPLGPIHFKQSFFNNQLLHEKAEYSELEELARKHELSIKEIIEQIKK
jgi:uncharacterized protein (TIGR00299 family) protein